MLPTVNVWVVPTFTSLGTQITSSLCQLASKITLSSATSIPQNALKVVQKLVSEKLTERYVARGETIGISFRGKPLYLTVEDVTTIDDDIDKLEAAVSELHLNDEIDSSTHLLRAVYSAIKDPMRQAKFRLFHIDSKTTAIMASQNQEQERPTSLNQGPFVAGLDDIIQQVKSTILTAMFHPEAYGQLKGPRGCLIFGAHGVGKSALAKQLMVEMRDDHEEVDVEFVHCASLQSLTSIVGEGERRLAKLFDRTKKTLLILDDIHFICPRRGSGAGVDRIAATLLALLDGVISKSDVYVIATTTDPSLLDPALRRPGRLDAEVEIPIPDERTRAKIWKFHLDNMNRGEEIALDAFSESDMVELAASAKGFNGADCMLALKEAARIAAKSSVDEPIVNVKNLRSAIAATKPSTISSITVEVPHVYWSSIGGMQDVKDKLREAIELPLTHADLFAKLSIPPPRGVLLYGPPGCSKTLMARALATEGRMNFLAVKGPELLSKWLGESERALATLFRRARMASPCTIFFDEVDAIAAKRGSGQSGAGGERLLSQLLTELDGVGNRKEGHVIVVAATNRPDLLDHALTRPGRIDRKIYVGLPDKNSREQIFRIGLKDRAHSPDIDVSLLSGTTPKYISLTQCHADFFVKV
jgi:SpoVK/Ycf46/Vps4 family AAA+-type ATPase